MTSLFLSYSSADRPTARDVGARLRAAGIAAVFLDVDPEQGIAAGQRWEQELYRALRRCDAVVYLGSAAGNASQWCFAELALARSLNMPVFPVRIGGASRHPLIADLEEIDLADGDAAFNRLDAGLRRAGLDPDDSFAWDPLRCPYPGLSAYTPADAAVFFGRDREIRRLLDLLNPTLVRGAGRCIGVVGPSGSGKSSLVHAGLLPRLARPPQRFVVVPPMTPAASPTQRLASVLSRALVAQGRPVPSDDLASSLTDLTSGPAVLLSSVERLPEAADGAPNVLLVVDQAEELVTRTGPREQQAFLRLLRGALREDSPLWVVATLRSEFLSTAPDRAGLTEIIDDPLLVEPLARDRLPEVIARPAARAGIDLEPGLIEQMAHDTSGGDALPLLAYTLRELAVRGSRRITAADYAAIGGVVGALQQRADQLVDVTRRGLGQAILPTLLRLASVDADGVPVRRRISSKSLSSAEQTTVNAFVDARLLTSHGDAATDAATIEVAHEALLRQWGPLRRAIEQSQRSLRLRADLGREAADWEAGGRDPADLLRPGRLASLDDWAAAHPDDLDPERFPDALMAKTDAEDRYAAE